MRRHVWILRACLLLVAGGVGLTAVEARQADEPDHMNTSGLTGQRQPIEFEVDGEGRPRRFATTIYSQCPAGREWAAYWAPRGRSRVAFDRTGRRFRAVERAGRRHFVMAGRMTRGGLEGHVRAVWRFERDGELYVVCDSGFVPFAAGDGAPARLGRMRPSGRPWTLYPEERPPARPASPEQRRFVARLDAACERARRGRPTGVRWEPYLRSHEREYRTLAELGPPPLQRPEHAAWLRALALRASLERDQQLHVLTGDLESAARRAAQVASLRARANATGLRLGLRACTATGPVGIPKSGLR